MLLLLSTTHAPATDLGYVLRKHPDHVSRFALPFGVAHVYWPEASAEKATVALQVDIDPVALSRRSRPSDRRPLEPYVNDRPYVASSFLSVAISSVFSSAMAGRAPERPDLVDQPLPLTVRLPALSVRGGEAMLRELFEPLGYRVSCEELGQGVYAVEISGEQPVHELLGHLYVLVPVLDDAKHYWVGDDEVDKLMRHGEGWLAEHPSRDRIVRRYLKHQSSLARAALARLSSDEAPPEDPVAEDLEEVEGKVPLAEQRFQYVFETMRKLGVSNAIDLGCGEAKMLKRMLSSKFLTRVGGMDVSGRALEVARERLDIERLPEAVRDKLSLFHGSLLYRDRRLQGWDMALCVEVIEHIEPDRLGAFEDTLFAHAAPTHVVITTPNIEYNARIPAVKRFRHADHRFEWTRAELAAWAQRVAAEHGYSVTIQPIGPEDPEVGAPTQAALFSRGAR
jgi:3' terminal RNA ribose 2'-O-methyltransferase Hen1